MWAHLLAALLILHCLLRMLIPEYACIAADLWALISVQVRPPPPPRARPIMRKPPPIPDPGRWQNTAKA
jgi:hypothetical protein